MARKRDPKAIEILIKKQKILKQYGAGKKRLDLIR
jgi:hypothetical protein